ncbi:cytochrome P450 [Frankia canadensis]|uniref:cytochrome P450 n=1 Tax=Frankia canadensis TaxID=1836972 RepID=UPI0014032C5E|nr:cytochrome P450 [Frankia canadensis]
MDHHSADYIANAQETHARLREECPVGWSDEHGGFWVLSRYREIKDALKRPELFSSARIQREDGTWDGGAAVPANQSSTLLYPLEIDPPESSPYRAAIAKWMSRSALEQHREPLTAYINATLDRVEPTGRMDIVTEIGMMPGYMVALLLGIDPELAPRIAWPFNAMDVLERDTPEFAEAQEQMGWLVGFLAELCRSRRENPGDDNVSALVMTEFDGEPLPLSGCLSTIMTVIGGGVATTTAALEHCLGVIDSHPEIRARLIADPSLIPQAVEEAIRIHPPVLQVARRLLEDTTVDGVQMFAGERVLGSVLSANHDSSVFPNPEAIDIDRPVKSHLTFGFGVHRCVGIEVARMELNLMIGSLLKRFPDFRVVREECRRFVGESHNNGYSVFPIELAPKMAAAAV